MSPKDQTLKVVEKNNGNNGNGNNGNGNNGNGLQTEDYFKSDHRRPHLDERFITNIKGKDFVLYAGLLDLGHQMGLKKLQVQPIQYPTQDNGFEGICKAIAETTDGKIFEDLGDANPSNCHTMVSRHILRMASTRSKARVLRDMTNIGITCFEEIGDPDEVIGNEEHPQETRSKTRRRTSNKGKSDSSSNNSKSDIPQSPKSNGCKTEETPKGNNGNESRCSNNIGPKASSAQRRAIESLARRKGLQIEEIDKMSREIYNTAFDYLSSSDASSLIQHLQQPA